MALHVLRQPVSCCRKGRVPMLRLKTSGGMRSVGCLSALSCNRRAIVPPRLKLGAKAAGSVPASRGCEIGDARDEDWPPQSKIVCRERDRRWTWRLRRRTGRQTVWLDEAEQQAMSKGAWAGVSEGKWVGAAGHFCDRGGRAPSVGCGALPFAETAAAAMYACALVCRDQAFF
jgi:hypothetical protein